MPVIQSACPWLASFDPTQETKQSSKNDALHPLRRPHSPTSPFRASARLSRNDKVKQAKATERPGSQHPLKSDIDGSWHELKEWQINRYACDESKPYLPSTFMSGPEDGNIAAWSGKWWEWNGDRWKKNSNIKVKCAGD